MGGEGVRQRVLDHLRGAVYTADLMWVVWMLWQHFPVDGIAAFAFLGFLSTIATCSYE